MCVLCWLRGLQGGPLLRDLETDSRTKTNNEGPQPVLGYNGNSVLKSAGDIFFSWGKYCTNPQLHFICRELLLWQCNVLGWFGRCTVKGK